MFVLYLVIGGYVIILVVVSGQRVVLLIEVVCFFFVIIFYQLVCIGVLSIVGIEVVLVIVIGFQFQRLKWSKILMNYVVDIFVNDFFVFGW